MADYNQQSGYTGQGPDYNQQRGSTGQGPVSTYNAQQDEFGFKEGSDYSGEGGYGDQKFQQSSGQGQGYGGGFQDATDQTTGYGDADTGVGGE